MYIYCDWKISTLLFSNKQGLIFCWNRRLFGTLFGLCSHINGGFCRKCLDKYLQTTSQKTCRGNPNWDPNEVFWKYFFSNIFILLFFFQIKFAGSGVDYRLEDRLLRVGRTVEIIILTIRLFTMHFEAYVQGDVK